MKFINYLIITFFFFQIGFLQAQSWKQLGQAIEGEAGDLFGFTVSLAGNGKIVAVGSGAPGGADEGRVFSRPAEDWQQIGNTIKEEDSNDQHGFASAISDDGKIVAISGRLNSGSGNAAGHVRVFRFENEEWIQMGNDIDGQNAEDQSGFKIALSADGQTIAITAIFNSSGGFWAGHVRVFNFEDNKWVQLGSEITGNSPTDQLGKSVSLSSDGKVIAVGSSSKNYARVLSYDGTNWVDLGTTIEGQNGENFGSSISISGDGNIVAIGGEGNQPDDKEVVRVYGFEDGDWKQIGADLNSEEVDDNFGFSISLSEDGNILAVGSPSSDGAFPESRTGKVKVFSFVDGSWSQLGLDINAQLEGDQFGYSVSISNDGDTLAVGAVTSNGNGDNSGHVRLFSFDESTSVDEQNIVKESILFEIFPNPASDQITLKWSEEIVGQSTHLSLFNVNGKLLFQTPIVSEINVAHLESGLYLLKMDLGDSILVQKFLKL